MTRTFPFLVAAGAMFSIVASAAGQPERRLTAPQAREDCLLARRALESIHPGFDRYTARAEVLAAFDELERLSDQGPTEGEFFAALSVALARIRCSHTKSEPSEAWSKWRASSPSYVPFRFVESQGRMIVTRSGNELLRPGDQIVAINGQSAEELMARVLAAVPADGWTEGARRFALSSMSDLDESEFDHFLPAFLPLGDSLRLEVRRTGEATSRSVTVDPVSKAARAELLKAAPPARNLDEAVSLTTPADGVAVLSVGTFVAYRKQIKPEAIYRPFFETIATSRIHTLILDLRDNGGGSDSAAIDLTRFLVAEPVATQTRQWVRTYRFGDLVDKLETWDRSILSMPEEAFTDLGNGFFEVKRSDPQPLPPLEPGFRGRLIVLCGPANASGATLFLAGLRARRPVTLIGQPTGGSVEGPTAGVILFLRLPNSGMRVRIPAIRSVTAWQGGPEGGVSPDILIAPDVADILAGRDPVLQKAIEVARSPDPASR